MSIIDFIKNNIPTDKFTIGAIIIIIICLIAAGFAIYYMVGLTGNIPWHKCIIPYVFNEGFTDTEKDIIKKYMNIITESSKTNPNDNGITFIEKGKEIEFIVFNKIEYTGVCGNSYIAKQLGGQTINLASICISEQAIIHEVLHALGFIHEHCRSDRDKYITLNYNNISDDQKPKFDIENNIVSDTIINATDYDHNSIMHYQSYLSDKNDKKVIELKDGSIIKNNDKLSDMDKKRLKMYYNTWK